MRASIAIFEGEQIYRSWDEEKELWYFAISNVKYNGKNLIYKVLKE